jgi:hypothetical protein
MAVPHREDQDCEDIASEKGGGVASSRGTPGPSLGDAVPLADSDLLTAMGEGGDMSRKYAAE